jgi:hypothetical protein
MWMAGFLMASLGCWVEKHSLASSNTKEEMSLHGIGSSKTVLKIQRMKEMCILIVPCSGWRKVSGYV